jgi:hypothetical protein
MSIYYLMILGCLGGAGVVLALIGWLFLQASTSAEQDRVKLVSDGVAVEAEIVNLRRTTLSMNLSHIYHVSHYITFKYTVTGPEGTKTAYTREKEIYADDYHALKVGDHIGLRVLPDDPETLIIVSGARAVITASSMKFSGTAMIVLGGVLVLIGVGLCIGITNTEHHQDATATAYTIRESATPEPLQETATVEAAQGATATVQTEQTITGQISQALASHLPEWRQVSDQAVHRIRPPETDLGLNELEIDYGYCGAGHFYAYVWLKASVFRLQSGVTSILEGYGYVDGSTPADCHPQELYEVGAHPVQDHWFLAVGQMDVDMTATATP